MNVLDPPAFPAIDEVVHAILDAFPEHHTFLDASLSARGTDLLRHSEVVAEVILRIGAESNGGLAQLARDYRFLCEEIVLPEEIHFRRTGTYRLTSFSDALDEVYSRPDFMGRYMNGLLVSNLAWLNHCQALHHFSTAFLPDLPGHADLLEIGPGHGLLLYLATRCERVGRIFAWDVSRTSLALSRRTLGVMQTRRDVQFELRDVLAGPDLQPPPVDAIVFSEILEHLEDPAGALSALFRLCKPGGRVWINVPANSPAPDHLYLVRDPAEVAALARSIGFEIADQRSFPMTGYTLERALRRKLTISCLLVCQRPT